MGNVIYSLPVIRKLGGGILILSDRTDKIEINNRITLDLQEQLKKILVKLPYIFDVKFSSPKPDDIDYDLNDKWRTYVEWGNGNLSEDEVEKLRNTDLVSLYEKCFNIGDELSKEAWLVPDKKISFESKPIIINRTMAENCFKL